MIRATLFAFTLASAFLAGQALAGPGDRAERHIDRKGERIENRLDRKGDRIDHRLDRASRRAEDAGKDRLARRLDRKCDRIDRRAGSRWGPALPRCQRVKCSTTRSRRSAPQ